MTAPNLLSGRVIGVAHATLLTLNRLRRAGSASGNPVQLVRAQNEQRACLSPEFTGQSAEPDYRHGHSVGER